MKSLCAGIRGRECGPSPEKQKAARQIGKVLRTAAIMKGAVVSHIVSSAIQLLSDCMHVRNDGDRLLLACVQLVTEM
jgi:hypothetical protein